MNKNEMSDILSVIDLNSQVPTKEPERQYYYIAKLKNHVDLVIKELGRKPTCCVTTFGCPTV